ncbi:hypothetical protein AB0284_17925 [Pseudarthrobacter phenanthrenivorans]|uniref:hypothetical protein n=1 Tax=Pseudarthrobacter phenanthrenivorans TaxID=361575 RepID=UPI00344DB389
MNTRSQHERPREAPEADALEQQTPVLPEGSDGFSQGPLPPEAPEADVVEQRTDVIPGTAGHAAAVHDAQMEAAEADLVEQAESPPWDDDEDYPDAHREPFEDS